MKELIAQYLVQEKMEEEDTDILHRKLFNVNMRLYNSNVEYKNVIKKVIKYMREVICTEFDDYAELRGLSGANVGIPLNIIAIKVKNKKGLPPNLKVASQYTIVFFFLNPKIVKHSRKTTIIESNCGSINLSTSVKVVRYDWIELESYDLSGKKQLERYNKPLSLTIQHEVDHNAGVLITDKIVKEV